MPVYKTYIAQVAQNTQIQPHSPQNQFDPMVMVWIGLGGIGTFLAAFIPKFLDSAIIAKSVDGRINQKQAETNASVAEKLTDINVEKQFAEGYIDSANAVAEIARQSVTNSNASNRELLELVKGSIEAAASHAQSISLLTEAKKHHVEATGDLANAMLHVSEALQSLTQAQEALPIEIAKTNEIYAQEFRLALDSIDDRLDSINKAIASNSNALKEQYTGSLLELRKDAFTFKKEILEAIAAMK